MFQLGKLQTIGEIIYSFESKLYLKATINQRLREVEITAKKSGISSFPKYIGISPGTYGNVVGERKSKPSIELIGAVLKSFPNLNSRWLVLGEGDMWIDNVDKKDNKEVEILQGRIAAMEKRMENNEKRFSQVIEILEQIGGHVDLVAEELKEKKLLD